MIFVLGILKRECAEALSGLEVLGDGLNEEARDGGCEREGRGNLEDEALLELAGELKSAVEVVLRRFVGESVKEGDRSHSVCAVRFGRDCWGDCS